jgi:hypothetical protein
MITLNELNAMPTKGYKYQQALVALTNDPAIGRLDDHVKLAIAYLVQAQAKKEVAKLKPNESPFKLASLFIGKKDVRYYLNEIHSTGTHLEASNGHTYIRINHAVEPGFYDALGNKTEMKTKYPVIGNKLEKLRNGNLFNLEGEIIALEKYNIVKIGPLYMMEEYVKQLKKTGCTHVGVTEDSPWFYFSGDNFEGIIGSYDVSKG